MSINREKCKKYCSILSAHLVLAPWSFMWIYGNLSAYTDSYIRFSCYPACADCDPQWLLSAYSAGNVPVLFFVKRLVKRFGLKRTGIVGLLMTNAALFGSAWSLNVSVAWTAAMYGVLLGTATGMTSSVVLQVISGWAPENAAALMATSTSFPTLLSVLQNQIITWYINPKNLKPNARIGHRTYFSQPEILDRVPGIFVILGAMTLGLQAVGYLLMSNPPDSSCVTAVGGTASMQVNMDKDKENTQLKSTHSVDAHEEKNHNVKCFTSKHKYKIKPKDNYNHTQTQSCSDGLSRQRTTDIVSEGKENLATDNLRSWTPSEVIKTPVFYAVFLFGMITEYGQLLNANFYKTFALLYIHNDQYLTLVGSLVPIISTCSRILFGTLVDKSILTLKDVAVFGLSVNCVMCAFWYIAPQVSHVLYMFLILGLTAAQSLIYVVIPISALHLFGPEHLSNNYALTSSCIFIIGLLTPVVTSVLLNTIGWFWLFMSSGLISLGALCYVILTKFNTQL